MYQIKNASLNEIQVMLSWAAAEGWNPGLDDARAFQLIDPNGFFIGYVNDTPAVCISNLKYDDTFSFLGLYIARPEFRGQGLGYQIWQHAMNYATKCNVGLDGVVTQQSNYQKSGFQLAYRNIRYCLEKNTITQHEHPFIFNNSPIEMILEYDKPFFPANREIFLRYWLSMRNAQTVSFVDKKIKGYGVIRQCKNGYKIGPLFADDLTIAEEIFKNLCSKVKKDEAIFLDIPEPNHQAKLLTQKFLMKPVFETARMYSKNVPSVEINRTYGITTFEVG